MLRCHRLRRVRCAVNGSSRSATCRLGTSVGGVVDVAVFGGAVVAASVMTGLDERDDVGRVRRRR